MRSISTLTLLATSAALGAHMVSSTPAHAGDKSVGESATVTTSSESAGAYYAITSDLRKCATPLCGGWFLAQVNQPTTQCHDGRSAAQCYAPELDWSSAGLSDAKEDELLEASRNAAVDRQVYAIVRGTFAPTNDTPRPELGRFIVTEAWIIEGDSHASGTFVWVHDNGLRCFAAPCRNLTERTLNTSGVTDIAEVDFAPAGLSDSQREVCTADMYGPNGLIVAGSRYTVHANGSTAPGRTASAAYRRLSDEAPVQ